MIWFICLDEYLRINVCRQTPKVMGIHGGELSIRTNNLGYPVFMYIYRHGVNKIILTLMKEPTTRDFFNIR